MGWSNEPRRGEGKKAHPPPRSQPQTPTPAQLNEGDVTNLYMWVAVVVVLSVVPHTRLGQRRHKQDWLVGSTKLPSLAAKNKLPCFRCTKTTTPSTRTHTHTQARQKHLHRERVVLVLAGLPMASCSAHRSPCQASLTLLASPTPPPHITQKRRRAPKTQPCRAG